MFSHAIKSTYKWIIVLLTLYEFNQKTVRIRGQPCHSIGHSKQKYPSICYATPLKVHHRHGLIGLKNDAHNFSNNLLIIIIKY